MNPIEQLTKHRRALHRIPELHRELPKTKAYILDALSTLDCQITEVLESGVCAYFDRGKETTTAYRADMDALPVTESNTHDFVSLHPGRAHVCGHDGHMAMGLAFAQYVNDQEELPSNVLMIFQPAEETTGGAKDICEIGILKKHKVSRVFGIHLWPFVDAGKVISKPNAMMPGSSEITVEVTGKTAHATAPEEGIDALYITCRFIELVYQTHAARQAGVTDPERRTLMQFCKLDSGTARNIISGKSQLLGTMRAFTEEDLTALRQILTDTASKLESEYGCTITLPQTQSYPPVINNPDLFAEIRSTLEPLNYKEMPKPVMISEDYSYYGQYAPSVFFLLGTGTGIALHSTDFDFDEEILLGGFELYKALLFSQV